MAAPVITGQVPIITKVNTSKVVTMDYVTIEGTGPYTFDFSTVTNCVVTQDSGVDDELIITPNDQFYGVATVLITVNDGVDDSAPFLLNIGVQAINIPGKGVPITDEGVTDIEGTNKEEKRNRDDDVIAKNPENQRRNEPFYSTKYPYTKNSSLS